MLYLCEVEYTRASDRSAAIIDIGAGESTLVDDQLEYAMSLSLSSISRTMALAAR